VRLGGSARPAACRWAPRVPGAHLGHQLAVLGVDAGDGPEVAAGAEDLVELAVPQHVQVLVGHEHLEGVHPLLPHQCLHLRPHLRRDGGSAGWGDPLPARCGARSPPTWGRDRCPAHGDRRRRICAPTPG